MTKRQALLRPHFVALSDSKKSAFVAPQFMEGVTDVKDLN